jgi:TPR repeat protein
MIPSARKTSRKTSFKWALASVLILALCIGVMSSLGYKLHGLKSALFGPDPVSLPSVPSAASVVADGKAIYEYGDYARALKMFTPLAEQGNGQAQAMVALIYQGQKGQMAVPRDEAKASQWAHKSAAQNTPEGLILLSIMYLTGNCVVQDEAQGLALMRRAVALDSAEAKLRLGLLYMEGIHIARDPVQGRRWITASAKQGFFRAQVALGRLVLNEGTRLGVKLPYGGDATPDANLPPATAAMKQAAQAGDAQAQLDLGRALYIQALREGRDVPDALPWIEKAAASGNAMAQFAAGALYVDGMHGVPASDSQASEWFAKGVAQLP